MRRTKEGQEAKIAGACNCDTSSATSRATALVLWTGISLVPPIDI